MKVSPASANKNHIAKDMETSASKTKLPRSLASPKLKEKSKNVFVFQGGSAVHRMQTAQMLADRLSLKVYRVDIRPFISRFIGETEKNLDKVFEHVDSQDTMLYFDEADCLFGKPNEDGNHFVPYVNGWVEHLNKKLKEYRGSVVVATNSNAKTNRLSARLKPVVAHIH